MNEVAAYRVRAVTAEDFAVLAELLPPLLAGTWSSAALAASSWRQRVLVDTDSAAIVGFAEYYVAADECHLLAIAIVPAQRRRGLARQLLQAVLEEAGQQQCHSCLLEVRRSNTAAQALYLSLGFVEAGCRRNYYPARHPASAATPAEDALLYCLSLEAP